MRISCEERGGGKAKTTEEEGNTEMAEDEGSTGSNTSIPHLRKR